LISDKANFGVYGNIDGTPIRQTYPLINHFYCEEVLVGMTHIAGAPSKYKPDALKCFDIQLPEIFVCGHSHILQVKRDLNRKGMLFIIQAPQGSMVFIQCRQLFV
jgi:predicted phosphodiesterase